MQVPVHMNKNKYALTLLRAKSDFKKLKTSNSRYTVSECIKKHSKIYECIHNFRYQFDQYPFMFLYHLNDNKRIFFLIYF